MLNIFLFCVLLLAVLFDLINPLFIARGHPGYNHLIHTVSELGTRESPVMNKERLNLAAIGILFCLFAVGEACLFRDNTVFHIIYSIGILVFGIGSVISGIYIYRRSRGFREDSVR